MSRRLCETWALTPPPTPLRAAYASEPGPQARAPHNRVASIQDPRFWVLTWAMHHNGVYWCRYAISQTVFESSPHQARSPKRNLAAQDCQTGRELGQAT